MLRCARFLILALLSAFVLGATAAASASAYEYVVEDEGIAEATSTEGTSGLSLLTSTIGGAEVKLDCTQDTFTGKLEAGGNATATILLKKCTVTKPANCTVPETIETKLKEKLIGVTIPEELFEGLSEGSIAEIKITGGSCIVAGTYTLGGTQKCELPKAEEELAEHEIVCKKLGSSLKLGTEAASFSSTEKAKLTGGEKFSARNLAFDITPPAEYMMPKQKQKVKIKARVAAEITEIKMLVGAATFKIEPNTCVKNYAANQQCEVEVEFNPAVMGNYMGIFVVHVMGDPANVYEGARLKGKW